MLAGSTFERPGEIALALDFGRARYAGIDEQLLAAFGLKEEQARV